MAVSGEIHRLDISLAYVARFYSDVIDPGGGIDRLLVLVSLAAVRAHDPAILPFGGAQRADQAALCAISLAAQDARYWSSAAEWTGGFLSLLLRIPARGEPFRVRLQ